MAHRAGRGLPADVRVPRRAAPCSAPTSNPQYRPNKKLILDVGARVQVAPERARHAVSYPVNTTVAGTVVWNFIPNWHLKLNYAQGFRPPVFNNTTSNGEGVQIGGNPNLDVETSDAAQAEINARIFKGERRIRELSFRVDGSYTRINNLIQVASGNYGNSGDRGIASVEFLGKLYVQGGHRLELGYTYLRGDTSDKGRLRVAARALVQPRDRVLAGREQADRDDEPQGHRRGRGPEPPRRVSRLAATMPRPAMPIEPGRPSRATDLVLDRLPPIAELSLGLTCTRRPRSWRSARPSTTRWSATRTSPTCSSTTSRTSSTCPTPTKASEPTCRRCTSTEVVQKMLGAASPDISQRFDLAPKPRGILSKRRVLAISSDLDQLRRIVVTLERAGAEVDAVRSSDAIAAEVIPHRYVFFSATDGDVAALSRAGAEAARARARRRSSRRRRRSRI